MSEKNDVSRKTLIKDILKTVLVLFLIAVFSGAILGLVNAFTQVDEMETLKTKIKNTGIYNGNKELSLMNFTTADGISISHEGVYHVFKSDDTYIIHAGGDGGYKGVIEILVCIQDDIIENIVKYSSDETYTKKVFADKYLQYYIGKNVSSIDVFSFVKSEVSDNGDVIAVTGATKSSTALLNAVNNVITWYKAAVMEVNNG